MAARIVKKKSPPKPEPVEVEEKEPIKSPPSLGRRLFPAIFFMAVLAAMVFAFSGSEQSEKTRPAPKSSQQSPQKSAPAKNKAQKSAAQIQAERYKERYEHSKEAFTQLDADDHDRDDVLAISQDFYALYMEAKDWPNRPAALYRAAEVMEFSGKHMDEEDDFTIAVNIYEKLAKEFPHSILADDALYAAARLWAFHLDDKQKALQTIALLRSKYPKGDTLPLAEALEKKLLPPPAPKKTEKPKPVPKSIEKPVVLAKQEPKVQEKKAKSKKPAPVASKKTAPPKPAEPKGPKERAVPEIVYKPVLMPASLFMSQAVHVLARLEQAPQVEAAKAPPIPSAPIPSVSVLEKAKPTPSPLASNPATKQATKQDVLKEKVMAKISDKPSISSGSSSNQDKKKDIDAELKSVATAVEKNVPQKSVADKSLADKKATNSKQAASTASPATPVIPANPVADVSKTAEEPSFWQRATQSIMAFWQDEESDTAAPTPPSASLAAEKTTEKKSSQEATKETTQQKAPKPAPATTAKVETKPQTPVTASKTAQAAAKTGQSAGQKGTTKTATKLPITAETEKKAVSLNAIPKPAPLVIPKPIPKPGPMPTTIAKTEPKPSNPKESSPIIQKESKSTSKSDNKSLAMAKTEVKPTPKPDSKPASKPSPKPAPKTEPKTTAKPKPKAEPKTESKIAPKTESKALPKPTQPLVVKKLEPKKTPPKEISPLVLDDNLSEAELNERMRNAPKGGLASQLGLSVRTVYIDIGHGGKDQGTAHNGLVESAVVLDIGKKIGELLKARGFNVVYSRTSNIFIPLSARSINANEAGADLFVSIHMNAFVGPPSVQGFETYYLDFTRNAEASRVATLENSVSDRSLGDLQNVLAKMLLNVRTKESQGLAKAIQKNTIDTLRAKGFATRNGGTRAAPFHVLIGTSMPAVLVEVGYCTHKVEASWLKRNDYRQLLARGITQGIIAYKEQLERQ